MKYSVVIPAYNEEGAIGEAITTLNKQTVGRENIEVIVSDNNSADNTSAVAKESGADKVVVEKRKGTNFAREAGYNVSTGDIIAFLDADCVPREDWLFRLGEHLKDSSVGAVSGPYDYGFKGIKKFLADIYSYRVLPAAPYLLHAIFRRKAGVLIGGNFAVRRGTMEAIGGFPPLAFWGDDSAIAMLVARKVGKVIFVPDVAVWSSPRRLEKEGFFGLTAKYVRAYLHEYFK